MTKALALLCRVVQRRLDQGEDLEAILADYPRLTGSEREAVLAAVSGGA